MTITIPDAAHGNRGFPSLPNRDRRSALIETTRTGLLSGVIAGVVAGVFSRVAMRLVALDAGAEPSFSVGGTAVILAMGAFMGAPLGLLFVSVKQWLPGPQLVRGAGYGVLALLAFLVLLVPLFVLDPDVASEAPGDNMLLGINVFATPLVLYGLVVAGVVSRIEGLVAVSRERGYAGRVGDILLAIMGLVGVVGILFEIGNIVVMSLSNA